MINLSADECDPLVVDQLVRAAMGAMERVSVPDLTTPSEILSASFDILERTLLAMRRLQLPEDRISNAREISRALHDMLTDFGKIPS